VRRHPPIPGALDLLYGATLDPTPEDLPEQPETDATNTPPVAASAADETTPYLHRSTLTWRERQALLAKVPGPSSGKLGPWAHEDGDDPGTDAA
jgi:hypothetical protein